MTEPDALSIHRSFILRLYQDVDLDAGEISGWVEHVISGEASEFRSVSDLIDFIGRCFATDQAHPKAEERSNDRDRHHIRQPGRHRRSGLR